MRRLTPVLLIVLFLTCSIQAEDYLSAEDVAVISTASFGLWLSGHSAKRVDSTHTSLITGTFPGEGSIQRFLAGEFTPGKRNILDSRSGSAVTPIICGTALFFVDMKWPRDDKSKDVAQDMFLYVSGVLATKGITDLAKGIFARPRPYMVLEPDYVNSREFSDYALDYNSFFSGHSSSAFFACAFLNMRVRQIMRQEMSASDYKSWRWAPPTILFGWASYVSYSRIQAYKHYLSDVIIGSAVGYLMAELFYSLTNDKKNESAVSSGTPMLFQIGFSF